MARQTLQLGVAVRLGRKNVAQLGRPYAGVDNRRQCDVREAQNKFQNPVWRFEYACITGSFRLERRLETGF